MPFDAIVARRLPVRVRGDEHDSLAAIASTLMVAPGGGFWQLFARAIAGGTVLATIPTFYFVPASFLLLTPRAATTADPVGPRPAPRT